MTSKTPSAKTIKAEAALTGAYSGWASEFVGVGQAEFGRLLLDVTKDDATTIELRFLVEEETGDTGYKSFKVSEGVAALDEIQLTAADLDTEDHVSIDLDIRGIKRLKVEAKKTGGSGTVNLAAKLVMHVEG